ncbi:hypothetical protein BDZ89DRAFT_1068637, partial [Hymenopellis radicata]
CVFLFAPAVPLVDPTCTFRVPAPRPSTVPRPSPRLSLSRGTAATPATRCKASSSTSQISLRTSTFALNVYKVPHTASNIATADYFERACPGGPSFLE